MSLAVAASAAVPVVFAPVVIQSYPGGCPVALAGLGRARAHANPNAPPLLKLFADALERYRTGEIQYVKLLDGGMVDNYGLAGFTIARLASDTPLRSAGAAGSGQAAAASCSCVVDSGRAPSGQMGADHGRAVRRRSHHGDVRYRDRVRRDRQLFGVRGTMNEWQETAGQLALRALGGRAPPVRRAAGLELPGREILHRPNLVRSIGSRARGRAQRRRNQLQAAAGSGRNDDRGGRDALKTNKSLAHF